MTRLASPAPWGADGLPFGATSPRPYSVFRRHQGCDHQWFYANPIRSKAVASPVYGLVTAAFNDGGNHNGWGNYVDIAIPVTDRSNVFVRLAHHATGSVLVRVGQMVNVGDIIGVMGDTGEAPGGPHLHEELWINGKRVDPNYYRTHDIPGTPTTSGGGSTPFPTPTTEELEMRSVPIVNVIAKYGEADNTGTVQIGREDGTFVVLGPKPGTTQYEKNIRGIVSKVFLGDSDGTKDTIPTISAADFEAVKRVWALACGK